GARAGRPAGLAGRPARLADGSRRRDAAGDSRGRDAGDSRRVDAPGRRMVPARSRSRATAPAAGGHGAAPVPAVALARCCAARGWPPFDFQRRVWAAIAGGEDGLLPATTGAGKTYAVWFGALQLETARLPGTGRPPPLTVLWISPMRALSADTARALAAPLPDLGADWTIGVRTGDTGSAERAAQSLRLPTALVTTPESLSLMLSRPDARATLATVRLVVVDEWHELLGSKRGVQVQLALARLRRWCPGLRTWGLSATLGNLDEALAALLPACVGSGTIVEGRIDKPIAV